MTSDESVERLRCLVKGCQNYRHQGRFVGDLCSPCHEMITTGRVHHVNITFIGDLYRQWMSIEGERAARHKLVEAYRMKDVVIGVLFERLNKAGIDCSDLIS